jgi:hypothetical protein
MALARPQRQIREIKGCWRKDGKAFFKPRWMARMYIMLHLSGKQAAGYLALMPADRCGEKVFGGPELHQHGSGSAFESNGCGSLN